MILAYLCRCSYSALFFYKHCQPHSKNYLRGKPQKKPTIRPDYPLPLEYYQDPSHFLGQHKRVPASQAIPQWSDFYTSLGISWCDSELPALPKLQVLPACLSNSCLVSSKTPLSSASSILNPTFPWERGFPQAFCCHHWFSPGGMQYLLTAPSKTADSILPLHPTSCKVFSLLEAHLPAPSLLHSPTSLHDIPPQAVKSQLAWLVFSLHRYLSAFSEALLLK